MGFPFDAALASPDGRCAVVYQRLGTKALVLYDGRIRREIDRSYYCAEAYDHPLAIFCRANRLLIARCSEYDRLEIEDALTGESVLGTCVRKPTDFFYSQLVVNPSGTRLASAGWIWHPVDAVEWFDIDSAIEDGGELDTGQMVPECDFDAGAEHSSALWLDDDRLLVAERGPANRLHVFDTHLRTLARSLDVDAPLGRMMRLGRTHIVAFHEHPRIVSLETGKTVHTFTELDGGNQLGPISVGARCPPIAMDEAHARFAIADATSIAVVDVDRLET